MNKTTRMICILLSLLLALSLPLYVPSGALTEEGRNRLMDECSNEEEQGAFDQFFSLLRLVMPTAYAVAEADVAAVSPLPFDLSPGLAPDPAGYTDAGYQDASITVKLETIETDSVIWRIAHVSIAHPSQLRTAMSKRDAYISSMAEKNNAVIAINGDYYTNDVKKKSFEYRMGKKIRAKLNAKKDLLIIDENGDFNLFVQSQEDEVQAFSATGRQIINAFTFGPALVKDSALLTTDKNYSYNPNGREPRMAIGQMAPLSYVLVLAEGRLGSQSQGVTHQELADFMYELGCTQAFNLDGGNSATMVFNGGYYQTGRPIKNERMQSDMIYFATTVDSGKKD